MSDAAIATKHKRTVLYNSSQLTKEYVQEIKKGTNGNFSDFISAKYNNSGDLVFVLENLGVLPKNFDSDSFLSLFSHESESVRYWAVKNIGKFKSEKYLSKLIETALHDESTIVRREAVSSIGRMRCEKTISHLLPMLNDADPKVVC